MTEEPACWSWPLPPLPARNSIGVVVEWQDGRCAICGERPDALQEDHDHSTGDTRGYLCASCNVTEARSVALRFVKYRERPPTALIGVLHRYRCGVHPVVRDVLNRWATAIGQHHEDEREFERYDTVLRNLSRQPELDTGWRPKLRLNKSTALLVYIERVGLSWEEWYGDPDWPWRLHLRRGALKDRRQVDPMRAELARWVREQRYGEEAVGILPWSGTVAR